MALLYCKCGETGVLFAQKPRIRAQCGCNDCQQKLAWAHACGGPRPPGTPHEQVFVPDAIEIAGEKLKFYQLRAGSSTFCCAACCNTVMMCTRADLLGRSLAVFSGGESPADGDELRIAAHFDDFDTFSLSLSASSKPDGAWDAHPPPSTADEWPERITFQSLLKQHGPADVLALAPGEMPALPPPPRRSLTQRWKNTASGRYWAPALGEYFGNKWTWIFYGIQTVLFIGLVVKTLLYGIPDFHGYQSPNPTAEELFGNIPGFSFIANLIPGGMTAIPDQPEATAGAAEVLQQAVLRADRDLLAEDEIF